VAAQAAAIWTGLSTEETALEPVWAPNELARLDDSYDASLLDDEVQPEDDLAAYNRYLALLAVKGKAKTWRNPHGI